MALRRIVTACTLGCTLLLAFVPAALSASQVAGAQAVQQLAANKKFVRVIAKLADVAPETPSGSKLASAHAHLESVMRAANAPHVERIPGHPLAVLELNSGQLQTLVDSGLVESVEIDRLYKPLLADSVTLLRGPQGWNLGGRGQGQAVAILDTGVDANHPFLHPRVISEACFSSQSIALNGRPACPNGRTSQTGPGAGAPCKAHGCSHGTHVAGIAAGRGSEFSGVAPDANLVAIQVFTIFEDDPLIGTSTCTDLGMQSPCIFTFQSDLIRAMQHIRDVAVKLHVAAVNFSIGSDTSIRPCDTDTLKPLVDELRALNIATVIAAGNEGAPNAVSFPACISTAITVSATTKLDTVSSYSNCSVLTDYFAPGDTIYSSVPGGGFAVITGSSMAAPHVTGAIAAVRSAMPNATLTQIESVLSSTGRKLVDTRNKIARPRVNVGGAVGQLSGFRQHGNLIQSTWGRRGNFELVAVQGDAIEQYSRNNDEPTPTWRLSHTISYANLPSAQRATPVSATLLQSTARSDGRHGNYELIVRVKRANGFKQDSLDGWTLKSGSQVWQGPYPVLADGEPIAGVTGDPVLLQSTRGERGNYELFVPRGNAIYHYTLDNDDSRPSWRLVDTLSYTAGGNTQGPRPTGVTAIQSTFFGDGKHGNFELVTRVQPANAAAPDYLDYWSFDSSTGNWTGPSRIVADGEEITGLTGDPALVQSTWGIRGQFELLVPQGRTINHYVRDNDDPKLAWHLVRAVSYKTLFTRLGVEPGDVSLIQSTISGDGVHGDFELMTRIDTRLMDRRGYLHFWYFDSLTGNWNGQFLFRVGGEPVFGITGF